MQSLIKFGNVKNNWEEKQIENILSTLSASKKNMGYTEPLSEIIHV